MNCIPFSNSSKLSDEWEAIRQKLHAQCHQSPHHAVFLTRALRKSVRESPRGVYKINTAKCKNSKSLYVRAWRGRIEFYTDASEGGSNINCLTTLVAPANLFLKVSVQDRPLNCNQIYVFISPKKTLSGISRVKFHKMLRCIRGKWSVAYMPGNVAYIAVTAHVPAMMDNPWLTMLFESQPTDYARTLAVVRTSPLSGYLAHTAERKPFPHMMNASSVLLVPKGKMLLISFEYFDLNSKIVGYLSRTELTCNTPFLSIYDSSEGETTRIASRETYEPFRLFPRVYNGTVVFFFFSPVYDSKYHSPDWGFKIRYGMYPPESAPTLLPDGTLNCSSGNYDVYSHHVHCDFQRDCHAGEDERNCSYSSSLCNDSLAYGDSCYTVVTTLQRRSWHTAREYCIALGGNLVSINTKLEYETVTLIFNRTNWSAYVGLQGITDSFLPAFYKRLWRWSDGSVAYNAEVVSNSIFTVSSQARCGLYDSILEVFHGSDSSCQPKEDFFAHLSVCEFPKPSVDSKARNTPLPPLPVLLTVFSEAVNRTISICDDGSYIRDFLYCDPGNGCVSRYRSVRADHSHTIRSSSHNLLCHVPDKGTTHQFVCDSMDDAVHYSFVCNEYPDCPDGSDEDFCQQKGACLQRNCFNSQCVDFTEWCDGTVHCSDGTDELLCAHDKDYHSNREVQDAPAIINIEPDNSISYRSLTSVPCPETHFQCPRGYCLPVFVRCNGVYDCPFHQDEEGCHQYTCPGFYRCQDSSACMHPDHVCDGIYQCPQQDDEWRCGLNIVCPAGCLCQGLAFVCRSSSPSLPHHELRYLDASHSGLAPAHLNDQFYLVELHLENCGLTYLAPFTLPNLRKLYLSYNLLTQLSVDTFSKALNLHTLVLKGNPLEAIHSPSSPFVGDHLRVLDLSSTALNAFDSVLLSSFKMLSKLNLSNTPINTIGRSGFTAFPNLRELNLHGCPTKDIPRDPFRGIIQLQRVDAENFRFCCSLNLPSYFEPTDCLAPEDDESSCADLLHSNVSRTFLWLFCCLAVVGNAGCFLFRVIWKLKESQAAFHVFVANLSVSDFCMGIYLAMVGVADGIYSEEYVWFEHSWKASVACKVAGFLALVSSEVSALMICLITLDRFMVLTFPFSRLHFSPRSSALTCAGIWLLGIVLGTVPLWPSFIYRWRLYEQSGLCIPLPFTTKQSRGQYYSFSVMIVLNFVLFLLVALGQAAIYRSVHASLLIVNSTTKSRDMTIARRLLSVAVTDFLCWFPIGLLGLLAARGVSIPGVVNVNMAILVLPLNSALNPFLYTYNTLVERRRRVEEQQLMTWLQKNSHSVGMEVKGEVSPEEVMDPLEVAINHLKRQLVTGKLTRSEILTSLYSAETDISSVNTTFTSLTGSL